MSEDLEIALRQMDYRKPDQVTALSGKIRSLGYRHVHELIELRQSSEEDLRLNATAVLIKLSELAIVPLLDSLSTHKPDEYVWEMQRVTRALADVRLRVVTQLDSMLENTDPVPIDDPEQAYEEEQYPPRRVCDEAYLMLRQILALESENELLSNTDVFFAMTDAERDEEIARFRKTREWRSLIAPREEP